MNSIVALSISGLFAMIIGLFKVPTKLIFGVVILSLLLSVGLLVTEWDLEYTYYNDMLFFDNFALSFAVLLCLITLMVLMVGEVMFEKLDQYATEHYALYIFALIGMICMVAFDHLSMLFVGIEIMSISMYILAGTLKRNLFSNEASLKYLLLGAFTTGVILMGITLTYGATGSFHLDQIVAYLRSMDNVNDPLLAIGILMLLAGMAFKISLFPFHFWTPDVYQGAPTHVTLYMSTAVKVAGFAAFYRLFYYAFIPAGDLWVGLLTWICAATITVGTFSAIVQNSMKRILAYSSIAHAGYILFAYISPDETNSNAIFYYCVVYSVASIIALSVTVLVEKYKGSDMVESFNGLAKSNPILSTLMALSMLSLAGIPVTGGFFAKFYLFSTGIQSGYMWLVLLAVVNAIAGMVYYFKVIINMFFKENQELVAIQVPSMVLWVLIFCAVLTLQFGIFPDAVYYLF